MKKTISRSIVAFTALLLAVVALVALVPQKNADAETTKTMDIFLIAGQSNAAGESYANNIKGTFPNVLYAGEATPNLTVKDSSSAVTADKIIPGNAYDVTWPFNPVTQGLGSKANYIGPEFGMARYLNTIYTAENPCMILKTAAGAVGLYRDHTRGNYDPDGRNGNTRIGFLYRRLLENLTAVKQSLSEQGYAVNVKAFIWMQGENEMTAGQSVYSSYPTEFKNFAKCMREDIGAIVGKTYDQMVTDMPFVLGEIALNGGEGKNGYTPTRAPAFVEVQRTIPSLVENCRLIRSSCFATDVVSGNPWHWSGKDMVIVGEMFARSALGNKAFDFVEYGTLKNGGVIPELSADESKMSFFVYPTEEYKLTKLTVNDEDVTDKIVDGVYTTNHTASATYTVSVECVPLKRFNITNNYKLAAASISYGSSVKLSNGQRYILEGEMLEFTFTPKKGYTIDEVKVNETVVEPTITDEGKYIYSFGPVNEDITIKMSSTKADAEETPPADTPSAESGCGKESIALALSAFGALALAAFIIKK